MDAIEYMKLILEILFYVCSILGLFFVFFRFLLSDRKQKATETFLKFHEILGDFEIIKEPANKFQSLDSQIASLNENSHQTIREGLTKIEAIATGYNAFCLVRSSKRSFDTQFSKEYHQPIIDYLAEYIKIGKGTFGYKSFFNQSMKMFGKLSSIKKV